MSNAERGAVLVTGGAGYIGAHTAKALAEQGRTPVVFDDLSAGHAEAVRWGPLLRGDIRDGRAVREALQSSGADAIVHFAGLIEVGRSAVRPDLFWDVNVTGTAALLEAARDCGVKRIVFSSSAAVYGQSDGAAPSDLLAEDRPKAPASPYGDTKLACERMIDAHCRAFGLSAVALRYFNAAGADPSGEIGEAHEPETHLIPLALGAALGRRGPLTVFGDDFATPDGTCLRDYIHVSDLADAHVAALSANLADGAFKALNLGTGQGRSVFEVIRAVEAAVGCPLPHAIGPRRAGDPASLVADPGLARRELGWAATRSDLSHIVATALRWAQSPAYGAAMNPA